MATLNSFASFSSSVITEPEGILVQAKKEPTGGGCHTQDLGPGVFRAVYYSSDTHYIKKGEIIRTTYEITRIEQGECGC